MIAYRIDFLKFTRSTLKDLEETIRELLKLSKPTIALENSI